MCRTLKSIGSHFDTQQSAFERNHAPRARPNFDLLDHRVCGDVHHGNVIGRAIRGVKRLAVR